MKNKIISIFFVFVFIILGVFLYQNLSSTKTSQTNTTMDNLSIRLKWIDQAQFAGIYVAQSKGIYKKNNLNVTSNPGGPDISPIQMVVSGVDNFGITSGNQILLARDKGVPVVAVAVIYQKSPIAIYSLVEKNIKSPKDLTNKKIGIISADDDEIIYNALLAKEGIDRKSITSEPKTFDLSQFINKRIDAEVGYEVNEPFVLKQKGIEVNMIKPRDYSINFYGDTIFTTEEMIKNNPELVRRFVMSTIEGWNIALNEADLAVNETINKNPKLVKENELNFILTSKDLIENSNGLGYSDRNVWQGMLSVLMDQGLIKNNNVESAYTNDFLK